MIEFNRSLTLTRNFTLGEFVVSDRFPEIAQAIILSEPEIQKCYLLALLVLQPARDRFGPMVITSGVRNKRLNDLVGGVDDSQHALCEAIDFKPKESTAHSVYLFITNELRWPGEVIYYEAEGRLHVALPRLGVHANHFTKKGVQNA